MISKERIKEIYEKELKNPAQVIKTQDLQDLCILALQSIEQSKLAKIKKALEFYADRSVWGNGCAAIDPCDTYTDDLNVLRGGKRARKALKGIT